ncbi:MFS transporter [Paraburkholderia guartelaensis]
MDAKSQYQPVRAALAAFLGTMIEWYDFYCYGTAAALVFGSLFFSVSSPFLGTLASLGTFAVGFLARPIGAVVFGHLGDSLGRKKSLIITLTVMGVATTMIGALPTHAQIGPWAAVLLVILRLVQGIAVGGEWGGAVLIAAEHAPAKWRTFLAAAPQYGSPIGLILATVVFRMVSNLPSASFQAWGWRVPFLLSGLLVFVAFLIRQGVNESPEVEKRLKETDSHEAVPVIEILRKRKRSLLLGVGVCLLGISGFYFVTTLMISYTTVYLGVDKSAILDVVTWSGVVELIFYPIGCLIAHRIGERRLMLGVTLGTLVWCAPMMYLISTGSIANISIAILVATALIAAYYAVLAPFLPKAFPVSMRYTGISLSFQLCGAIFGGTTPLIGLWVAQRFSGQWGPLAAMFAVISLGTFLCAAFIPDAEQEVEQTESREQNSMGTV